MRQYTLVFMEQRIGVKHLTAIAGSAGLASFHAADDEAALQHIAGNLVERLKDCARAELSSMVVVPGEGPDGVSQLVDDTHANPHFQDAYVRYDPVRKTVEFDWESTRTVMISNLLRV